VSVLFVNIDNILTKTGKKVQNFLKNDEDFLANSKEKKSKRKNNKKVDIINYFRVLIFVFEGLFQSLFFKLFLILDVV